MWRRLARLAPTVLVGGLLFIRNLIVWDNYSVNVLYWDQWDFWIHMFADDSGLWEMFNHQHGPHKMGIGYFYLYVVAELTDWNVRIESLCLVVSSLVTTGAFLWLKYRLFQRWHWGDAAIPLIVLGFSHYEIYFTATNPGLNVLPLFLFACIGLAITVENSMARCSLLVLLGFLATYTGFAIFAGLLVPFYFLFECVRSVWMRNDPKAEWMPSFCGFVLSSLGFWSFFWDYRFMPAVPNFTFPHDPVSDYALFVSKYWAHFFNLGTNSVATIVIGVSMVAGILYAGWRFFALNVARRDERDATSQVALFFVLVSLAFSLNVAIGRVSLGVDAGRVSRYLTFLVPFWVGAYFLFLQFPRIPRSAVTLLLIALFAYGDRSFASTRDKGLVRKAEEKRNWVEAYWEFSDIRKANQVSGTKVYPFEWAYDRQEGYIDKMDAEGLGFMKGKPSRQEEDE